MKRIAVLLALSAAALCPVAFAQAGTAPAPTKASCPSTKTLDDLAMAIYVNVSGPYDQDRACFRDMFLPNARLSPISKAKDGPSYAPRNLTVEDWITAIAKRGSGNFFEKATVNKVEQYGSLAHIWSTYESRHALNDPTPFARGINSIQAVYDGTRWRVQAILWQAEAPETPIPAKYLP
jgi:hypothetical protein